MSSGGTAANRYARAFFEYAQENDSLAALSADFDGLSNLIESSPEFAAFVDNPVIPEVKRDAILDTVLAKAAPVTQRSVRFLVHRDRLALLPGICAAFQSLNDELQGNVRIRIVAATELAKSQVDAICARIASKYDNATVIPQVSTDADLLGGFMVITGDQVIDCSIRSQLERMKKTILNA